MISQRIKNLGVRIVSALAAVGLLALAYISGGLSGLVILAIFLEVVVIYEGIQLIDWSPFGRKYKMSLGLYIYVLFLLILFIEPYRFQLLIAANILWLTLSMRFNTGENLKVLQDLQSRTLLALLYLGVFPALLVELLLKYQGALWFSSLMFMVFAGDVGAYTFGQLFGKRHVLPLISPKKTWEGAIGGFFCTLLCAYGLHEGAQLKIPLLGWLMMAGLISLVAQSGDFFESLLKRIAHVKDSGTIMPGHGGLLDRIDGVLFAAPIMSIALTYFDRWI